MKKRVIIFGLGKNYRKYENKIYKEYEVVATTSNNEKEKEEFSNYISIQEIKQQEYDYIIICSEAEVSIFNQLLNMGIKREKILFAKLVFNTRGVFYAQCNEDAVVMLLLRLMDIPYSEVFYLEMGTNHPVNINNTYGLYLLGAHGILVEPNRELKDLIEYIRPRDLLVNKAVSLDGKPARFYSLNTPEYSTLTYDELDKKLCDKLYCFGVKESYMTETITINELFQLAGKAPDVISIDIEGYDYNILCQIDFKRFRPTIFIVELVAYGSNKQDGDLIKEFFQSNGYILFHENGTNGIFVNKRYMPYIEDFCNI